MADNLTTFMCRFSLNLGASTSCNLKGLSRPVMGLLYLYPVTSEVKGSTAESTRTPCALYSSEESRWYFSLPLQQKDAAIRLVTELHMFVLLLRACCICPPARMPQYKQLFPVSK
jgi:hypothetical protein